MVRMSAVIDCATVHHGGAERLADSSDPWITFEATMGPARLPHRG